MPSNSNSLSVLKTNVQAYLQHKYRDKETKEQVRSISAYSLAEERNQLNYNELEGGELDLKQYKRVWRVNINGECLISPLTKLDTSDLVDLEILECPNNDISSVNLFGCNSLRILDLSNNNLTSLDFLDHLVNPEKLEELYLFDNKIELTNIDVFNRFKNLRKIRIGTSEWWLEKEKEQQKKNHFYGSFKSWESLTKLESIGFENTDVDSGLECLPESLSEAIEKGITRKDRYYRISCSAYTVEAKCKKIWEQLSPYNFDLKTWRKKNML